MPQIIEGELSITHGTGKNLFVLNPISTTYASVIVNPDEAKNLTQEDIGKRYRFCHRLVKVGISEFTYAYNLKESENITPEEYTYQQFGQFMNWFIKHYSTATIDGMFGWVDSMEKEVTLKEILDHYFNKQDHK